MSGIKIGDIYRAVATDRATTALILVTHLDAATGSLTVTLLSPDVEFGSSTDLILLEHETGCPYQLLAQSDVFGYLWMTQVDRFIGHVNEQVIAALCALRNEDAVDHPVAGPPVLDHSDPRWEFKLQERTRLRSLTADCTYELINGSEKR